MRMYDLIEKKKQGRSLTEQELDWMIAGFTEGAIPDYQMAAFFDGGLLSGDERAGNNRDDPGDGALRGDRRPVRHPGNQGG